ncbi:MAG: 4-hydroxy-tetrahydrodipicolinate synthase [Lactimicrobium massiliense]|nr:4-hydroxy-tetrahydrodipicolinate synthase [Lactimicrobium massiliense]MDD6560112.1 4-hydroxy-tetrahydrodipicolinate synthase [Lactimicrobium massiliense]
MKETVFRGAATAMITPMREDGSVDYEAMGRLIDWQIEQGIDALLIAGTSGEGSTLSDEEHREVLQFAVNQARGRVPMIAGTGSNDTAYACDLTKYACQIGYDACLVVTPYYNKTTQRGLIRMYKTIADASTKPLILYNVPSRTGISLAPATVAELSSYPHIDAIKEASGNISAIADIAASVTEGFTIYSGNDDQIIPILSLGGQGVISVLSNLLPKETSAMVHAYLEGNIEQARTMQLQYLPLIHALFCETNPIPVKAAMALMGYGTNTLRLPLVTMEIEHEAQLRARIQEVGLL